MNTYTFRPILPTDNKRVPALIEALGLTTVNVEVMNDFGFTLIKFIVTTDEQIEDLRDRMYRLINSGDSRFTGLHRCAQTLNEGTEPNENWWCVD